MAKDMTKKQIILLGVLSLAMVVLPYIWKFGNASVSSNTADWGSFATYLNGLLMPWPWPSSQIITSPTPTSYSLPSSL